MSDIIKTARAFYSDLHANNKKDWWDENRGTYDDVLKPFALSFLDQLAPQLADLSDTTVKSKLFRPHRDVRFSKDKTPYKTHMNMMWRLEADAPQSPVFFFGIGLDYVTAGAGMMGFEKPVLENWRQFADLDHKRLLGIFDDLKTKGYGFREPALKRVPNAYDKDHPAGELLRMKGVVCSKDIGTPADLEGTVMAAFKELWPLNALLIQVAEA
ncbi:TIGR02453 family protein [Cognatiyoonia sediminum]|uniref:TIGR02453 family protein n=1 Tax=Cognatiyoonia sediminum TaxID=1508389 RepID=A0A1M5N4I8_9RHOB|nr:DUF2461 domain-containing protein [Cognatiyoonia sediminum]SHG84484.1 TIGR02453 family protein [Cognatiyoonia sediminum]